jgi:outer membrane protein assembly factor BamB
MQTGDKIVSSATLADKFVLFGSYDGSVYCLRRSNGRRKWVYTTQAPIHGTPAVTPYGVLVAGCDGKLHVLNTATGHQTASYAIGTNVAASPGVVGPIAFIATIKAEYTAIDLPHKKILWREGEREDGAGCYASPSFDGGLVLFGSRSRRVFAVDARTGVARWTFRTRESVDSSPVVAAGVAVFGADDGFVYAIRARDGLKLDAVRLGGKISAAPAISTGLILIGGQDGVLHALHG